MKKLRVGVVGAGYLGKFHAEKYAGMDHVELVGVVDADRTQAETVAAAVSAPAYTDYRDLLGGVDAVSIVVPTPTHFAVSKTFLQNNVDVLIEKPMTMILDEADELIEIAEARGRIIQVGHLERFNPAVVALREIVRAPLFIESHRLSLFQPRGTDVSVVLDLMIHDIDIILNLAGSEVQTIHAAGTPVITDLVDIANARLEFASGCVANVTASRISMKSERKIRMFQREAYISVDFANRGITVVRPGEGSPDSPVPHTVVEQMDFPQADALDDELRSFVQAVTLRQTPEVTGKMGRDALMVALNIMAQIQKTSSRLTR
ncbi:MAG: Gfo/Idh/MocA family oxidoreductase [Desulfobacterales bacterium]|nr:Gfo/Idh/MocA family oxidoreductase [Desulfobacterales bacterium]